MESKKKTFNELITRSNIPVLVDFYATWCGPCQALSPVVSDIASNFKGQIKVIKVDVDKNQQAALKYGIRGVPTLILFQQGKVLWQKSGLMTRKELSSLIQSAITKN